MSSIRKHASIATLAVMGSRIAGLGREVILAFFFGASPVLDAFIAAFRIPNLLRDLFSEGALSNAFVTVFSKKIEKEGDEKAWGLASQVTNFIFLAIGSLVFLGILLTPWIVGGVASGFEGEKYQLTVLLTRILFPFILFVSLAAVTMGMLNTKGKFALPQSASTFFNITSIVIGLLMAYWMSPEFIGNTFSFLLGQSEKMTPTWEQFSKAITGMALGTLIGGLIQWIVQVPSILKLGYRFKLSFNIKDSGLWQVLKLTGPAIIGGAAVQINVLVNTNFASYLEHGSISWLNYAFRLMQFPLGIFGVAVAIATTPVLARLVANQKTEEFRQTIRQSIQLSLFLCIPSMLGLIALAHPIISLIYEHGQFGIYDTVQTSNALMAYAVGLCSYALIKIYQPAFLSYGDAKTPMLIALSSIALNAGLNWLFVFEFGLRHWGLALGTGCVACYDILLLTFLFRKKLKGIWNRELSVQLVKILVVSLIAVGAAYFSYEKLDLYFDKSLMHRLLLVFIPIAIATILYLVLGLLIGLKEMRGLLRRVKN